MKYAGLLAALLLLTTAAIAGTPNRDYVDGVLLVRFADDIEFTSTANGEVSIGDPSVDRLLNRFDLQTWEPFFGDYIIQDVDYRYLTRNDYKLLFPKGSDMDLITAEFEQVSSVSYVCPDWLYPLTYEPNDPSYVSQWWLRAIDAPEAWDHTIGSRDILVIPIDSGVDFNHPDIAHNVWVNPGEDLDDNHFCYDTLMGFEDIPGTSGDWDQMDNDGNGFINDFIGWDFVDNAGSVPPGEDGDTPDNNPMDYGGHGTGVSAAMAESGDNAVGGVGVAYNTRIMGMRCGYTDNQGNGYTQLSAAASALAYGVDMGGTVVNMSFGGYNQAQFMANALANAWSNGLLLFGAAGNDNTSAISYPANYPNVISVAALDNQGNRSYFSNYGNWVDIAAPGESCFTAWVNGYDTWQGTSVAAPIAAGVGALVASWYPNADNSTWSDYIINTTTSVNTDHPVGSGQVNAYNAITMNYWPQLAIEEWHISDPDGNGHPDVGEEIEVTFTVSNELGWQNANLAMARIDFAIDGVDYGAREILLGNIEGGSEVNNNDNPLTFTVPDGPLNGVFNPLTLTITSEPNDYEIGIQEMLMLGTPEILFVDDAGDEQYYSFIEENLDEYWYAYFRWNTNTLASSPGADYMQEYDLVIWMTGDEENPLTQSDQTAIQTAMDAGVNFFIFGQTLDEQLAGTDFYANYLHAESAGGTAQAALEIQTGDDGPEIPGSQIILVGPGGAGNSNNPDPITPLNGAVSKANYFGSDDAGLIFYDGDYKLVYCSFALESVSGASETTSRSEIVHAVLQWCDITDTPEAEPVAGLPGEWAIEAVYPNPFNPSTTLRVGVPITGEVKLRVFDLLGRQVATLANGTVSAGHHNYTWHADQQAAGVYFAVLEANGHRSVSKLTLVK